MKEEHFQNLWKRYYQSTNIEARRNMKLHLQLVPKRLLEIFGGKSLIIIIYLMFFSNYENLNQRFSVVVMVNHYKKKNYLNYG